MTEGYFIGRGDKTTCGGIVLDGDPRVNIFGLLHAREGGDVTCGKNGQTYTIVGGVSHIVSHGKRVAGTLDSFSSCPCQAQLLPSVFTATYGNEGVAPQAARQAAEPAPPRHQPPANAAPIKFHAFKPSGTRGIQQRRGPGTRLLCGAKKHDSRSTGGHAFLHPQHGRDA